MNESCAISSPGESLIGIRVRLVISSVSVPLKPGSTKPAVACTISPSRPMLDLPSMRATTSSGISTHSSVRPSTNSPGWMTNVSPSPTATSSVRLVGGSRRSIAAARWLWKTRNESPRRRSTDAGWTSPASQGSMTILPPSTRRRIVPSERTECTPAIQPRSAVGHARAGVHRAHARGRERQRVAVRAAPRAARKRRRGVRALLARAAVAAGVLELRLLLDGPVHEPIQEQQRDLQPQEEVEHGPLHPPDATPVIRGYAPGVRVATLAAQGERGRLEAAHALERLDARGDLVTGQRAHALRAEALDVARGERGAVGHGRAQQVVGDLLAGVRRDIAHEAARER